jgi:hypothetical protein
MDRDDLTIFENVIRQIGEATGWPLPTPFPFRQRARVNPDLSALCQDAHRIRDPPGRDELSLLFRLAFH